MYGLIFYNFLFHVMIDINHLTSNHYDKMNNIICSQM